MATLKLYHDWREKAEEKFPDKMNGLRTGRNVRAMSKTQVKGIEKLILSATMTETNDHFTIYEY